MPRADEMVLKGPLLKTWLDGLAHEDSKVKAQHNTAITVTVNSIVTLANILDSKTVHVAIAACEEDCFRANAQMQSLYNVRKNEKIGVLCPSLVPSSTEEMPLFADIIDKTHQSKQFDSNGRTWKIQFVRPHEFSSDSK